MGHTGSPSDFAQEVHWISNRRIIFRLSFSHVPLLLNFICLKNSSSKSAPTTLPPLTYLTDLNLTLSLRPTPQPVPPTYTLSTATIQRLKFSCKDFQFLSLFLSPSFSFPHSFLFSATLCLLAFC